jgi:hypothetical protein
VGGKATALRGIARIAGIAKIAEIETQKLFTGGDEGG